MPNKFSLKTEYNSFTKALIIDEIGEWPTILIDLLLRHGCYVYYHGKTLKENLSYLYGKNNFNLIDDLVEIGDIDDFNYCFIFLKDRISKAKEIFEKLKLNSTKIIVCHQNKAINSKEDYELLSAHEFKLKIVLYDQVYGQRITAGLLGDLFLEAVSKDKVDIDLPSEYLISPVSGNLLSENLLKIMFSLDFNNEIILLTTDKINLSSFVSILQKYCPSTNFIFSEGKEKENEEYIGKEVSVEENLDEKIEATYDWFLRNYPKSEKEEEEIVLPKISPVSEIPKESTKDKDEKIEFSYKQEEAKIVNQQRNRSPIIKKTLFGIFFFLSFIFIFFVIPFLLLVFSYFKGVETLASSIGEVEKGNYLLAISKAEKSKGLLALTEKIVYLSSPFYGLFGLSKPINTISESIVVLQNMGDSIKLTSLSSSQLISSFKNFLGEEGVDWDNVISEVNTNLSSAYQDLSLVQSSFKKTEESLSLVKKSKDFEKLKTDLPQTREMILKVKKLLTIIPQLLGKGERRTYLLIVQDNLELRPTGGFINAYGIINIENGKIINFEANNIYKADNLLKGRVEPPLKISEYLKENTWYFRDSNWEPDFPTSAQKTQWFLDKELQTSSKGVIAINLQTLKELLAISGGIKLDEAYGEITSENIFIKAQSFSETASATNKSDFLSKLTIEIFNEIKKLEVGKLDRVVKVLTTQLEKKEIMLYLSEKAEQSIISELGWSGEINNHFPTASNQVVINDYFMINEANVGVNKVNYFIKRTINQKIEITDQGVIGEKLTITLDNQSPTETWPSGTYKTYLRVYLPKDTAIEDILVSDSVNNDLWLPFDKKYTDLSESFGKRVLGMYLEVPILSKKKIEIRYLPVVSFDFSQKINSYLLQIQKQSGTGDTSYDLTITYPNSLVPLRAIPQAKVGESEIYVKNDIAKDFMIQVDFAR